METTTIVDAAMGKSAQLNVENAVKALKSLHCKVVKPDGNTVYFNYCLINYILNLSNLPLVTLIAYFDVEDVDVDIAEEAAFMVGKTVYIAKALIDDDEDLKVSIEAFEPEVEHFKNAFEHYISIINTAKNEFTKNYYKALGHKEAIETVSSAIEDVFKKKQEEEPDEQKTGFTILS